MQCCQDCLYFLYLSNENLSSQSHSRSFQWGECLLFLSQTSVLGVCDCSTTVTNAHDHKPQKIKLTSLQEAHKPTWDGLQPHDYIIISLADNHDEDHSHHDHRIRKSADRSSIFIFTPAAVSMITAYSMFLRCHQAFHQQLWCVIICCDCGWH